MICPHFCVWFESFHDWGWKIAVLLILLTDWKKFSVWFFWFSQSVRTLHHFCYGIADRALFSFLDMIFCFPHSKHSGSNSWQSSRWYWMLVITVPLYLTGSCSTGWSIESTNVTLIITHHSALRLAWWQGQCDKSVPCLIKYNFFQQMRQLQQMSCLCKSKVAVAQNS